MGEKINRLFIVHTGLNGLVIVDRQGLNGLIIVGQRVNGLVITN